MQILLSFEVFPTYRGLNICERGSFCLNFDEILIKLDKIVNDSSILLRFKDWREFVKYLNQNFG